MLQLRLAILALLAARQHIRMDTIFKNTPANQIVQDKPAQLLAEAMKKRDRDAMAGAAARGTPAD